MSSRCKLMAALLVLTISAPSLALDIGEKAPRIEVEEWLKGDVFTMREARGKKVIVLEFWATWCGPCRVSIPHLTELQDKYHEQNVSFLGLSDEAAATVKPFVSEMGDKMDYSVAIDPGKANWNRFCKPFGVRGIPHAFIIDRKGILRWHGHPQSPELESELEKIVKEQPYEVNENLKTAAEYSKKYFKLAMQSDSSLEDRKAAASAFIENAGDDVITLTNFVSKIIDDDSLEHKDLGLVKHVAKKAVDASNQEDWVALEQYAFALYKEKDYEGAVKYLKAARDNCEDKTAKEEIRDRINRLKKKLKK